MAWVPFVDGFVLALKTVAELAIQGNDAEKVTNYAN